uniref:Sulfotransferase domain-containing protein n=1 Tax=Heterosigma akashiwo TaxID=2829 RepID=A0A7S4D9J6_HETAK
MHFAYHMYWGESHKLTLTAQMHGAPGCYKHAPPTPKDQPDNANILVLRDPLDTIVSLYFFQGNHQQFVPKTYIFSQLELQKNFFTKVHDSYKFMRNSDVGAIAFVRYEELNKNSVEAVRQLFDFLPVSCLTDWDERFAQELYDRYSFDSMAKAEDKGQVKGGHPGGGDQKKVRSGLSFGFAEHIQPTVLRQVDAKLRSDAIFDPLFERYYESEMIALEEKAANTATSVDLSTNGEQLIDFKKDANTFTAPLDSMSDGGRLIDLGEATNAATMSMESTSNGAERL